MTDKKMKFFANTDALYNLMKMDLGDEGTKIEFTLDLIDQAMQFAFKETEERQFKMFGRSQLGANHYSPVTITSNDQVEGPNIQADFQFDGEMEDFLTSSYNGMVMLSQYISANKLDEMYGDMDVESEGVLIYMDEDQIKAKFVKDKERPYLLCFSSAGAPEMFRPYMNELTSEDIDKITHPTSNFACSGSCAGCSGGCGDGQTSDCCSGCGSEPDPVMDNTPADFSADYIESEPSDDSEFSFRDVLKLAEEGITEMMIYAANFYSIGIEGRAPEPEKAIYWMEKAANAGDAMAMYNMGMYCFFGYGMDINLEKALEWMEKACENGDEASPGLVEMCKDFINMRDKAKRGNPKDQLEYADAIMMINRDMKEFNTRAGYEEALKWYRLAKEILFDDELEEKIKLLEQMLGY